MRSRYLVALTFLLFSASAIGQTTQHAEEMAAIKTVIDKRTAALNARDANSEAMLFAQDADIYGSDGDIHAKGRDEIASLLGTVLRGAFRNANLHQNVAKLIYVRESLRRTSLQS